MIPTNQKIAILHPYTDKVGGAVQMMIYISKILHKNNDVTFYTLSYDKSTFPLEETHFVIKSYFPYTLLKFFSFICIAFQIRKKDIIIAGNSPMHMVGVFSKIFFRSKAKIVWWNHHYPWYYGKNTSFFIMLKQYIEKSCVKKIDIVLSNSKYLKNILDSLWNIDSKILYPVLGEDFLNNTGSRITKKNVIFSYGRRVNGKNTEMLFKVYDHLKNKIKDLVLIVGGNGEEIKRFKNRYAKLHNVKIVGRLDSHQILSYLNLANVFLFPSKIDSFGLVQGESMSSGVPVICFNKPHQEIVISGLNGFCVESENDFVQKTYEVLTNPTLREKLSLGCLGTSKRFTPQSFEKQLGQVFCL